MSTFTFPYWAKPALDFYNLKWPDVDEDQVAQLGPMIQQLANASWNFCITVKSVLGVLENQSESEALSAFHQSWGEYTDTVVLPVTDAVGQTAVTTTLVVANGITGYKASVLGVLLLNAAADIALIASGVGVAAAVAKKAVMREILELAMEELARHTAAWMVGQWNEAIDDVILGPIEDLARQIGADLGGSARSVVGVAISPATHVVGVAGARLYIDEHEIIDAVAKVKNSVDKLYSAADKLAHWTKGTGFTEPTPVPDMTLSFELKQAFDWFADAFMEQVKALGDDIINQVVNIITSTYDKYVEADTEMGNLAERLREQFAITPVAKPYVIDRSSRPKPIMIVDGPPPVITGQGISDARENIVLIDLPDAPEPVVTGAGESDARLSIRQIVLGEAPPPVVTGAGDSDARQNIKPLAH